MATKSVNINLTPWFVIWSIIFVVVAIATDDFGWLWWAAAPWFFVVGFMLVIWGVIGIAYLRGYPITLTTPRKGKRVVRRGRR